ncbi:MAG: hypothetical protein WDW38_007296 [Sanguina aurantia]
MSFVSVGGDGNNPTYFEVVAAEKLMPSLKSAIVYTMSVLSQRHPWVHSLLRFDDEVFAAVTLCLDWHSLSASDACFAEALYGLTRKSTIPSSSTTSSSSSSSSPRTKQPGQSASGPALCKLSQRQRWATLLCQILLPYIRAKANRLYSAHTTQTRGILALALQYQAGAPAAEQQQQHHRQWVDTAHSLSTADLTPHSQCSAHDLDRSPTVLPITRSQGPPPQPRQPAASQQAAQLLRARVRAAALRIFLAAWPWVHAGCEGAAFAYNLAFLLDASPMHHPLLHLLRSRLVRVSAQDTMAADHVRQASRSTLAASARQLPFPFSALRSLQLRSQQALTDNLGNGLLLAVFAFKGLEWWYTAAEDKLAASKALPLPPAPSRTTALRQGGRTASGPLPVPHLQAHLHQPSTDGCCPVTRLPATLDHIRKLYETS